MAKTKSKIELTRVNINLPTSLVEEIKEYADSIGINTTSAYIVLLNQALEYKTVMSNFPTIMEAYKKFEEMNGEDDK